MLESITVKNLALIKHAEIELSEGLNILSGETGAGKSILIGSVNYCLGAKADKSMIRDGAEYALMELVFRIEDDELARRIREMELPIEDGKLIISRRIGQKSSSVKLCGESVSIKQLKELAALLIDVHGQHEHQSLLHTERHLELLDAYCGEDQLKLLHEMQRLYGAYKSLKEKEERLSLDEGRRQRELALARYEVEEIEEADIRPGEEDELDKEYRRMKGARDAAESLGKVQGMLSEEQGGVLDILGGAVHEMRQALSKDEALGGIADGLSDAESLLRDTLRELSSYMEESNYDAARFAECEERLDKIRRLCLKYDTDEQGVLDYLAAQKEKLSELEDIDAARAALDQQLKEAYDKLTKCAGGLTKNRSAAAAELTERISLELKELNFLKAEFKVELYTLSEPGASGAESAEFLISLNPGEKLRPLKDVASGGELSRIMLALKSVFSEKDDIGTMIFDEIDTGISGHTAWRVAEKMGRLSRDRQLICITHLPQIAAMADTHFLIEKEEADGRTETHIQPLSKEEEYLELSRMLSGGEVNEAALANARQLKEEADAAKAGA